MPQLFRTSLGGFVLGALAACGGGSGGAAPEANGRLSLAITDAPMDEAAGVVVQFSGVAFKRAGSSPESVHNFGAPRQIDLMQHQGGRTAVLLDNITLPAGEYQWVRLMVDAQPGVHDSYLMHNAGGACELEVPSGAERGLQLNRGFTLPADGSVALTIDFDLRQSVHAPPGRHGMGMSCTQAYLMRPTLRIVDDANVGAIIGAVDSALVTQGCLPKVYVFSGADIVPDDVELATSDADVDPIVVSPVMIQNGATSYGYHAHFLPVGAYTLAFTCSDDDPSADDVLTFLASQPATVQANTIATVNFAPPPP